MSTTRTANADPKVHTFETSTEAYGASQCDDEIRDGDILHVPSEGITGILVGAWPTAITAAHGSFHTLEDGASWEAIPAWDDATSDYTAEQDYTASADKAREIAGLPVDWRGRTYGQLTDDERRRVSSMASDQLQAELERNAPALAKALEDAEPAAGKPRRHTRIGMTGEQAETIARLLRRPNLLGAQLQRGDHGYIELDLQARTTAGEPYGATWEITPAGSHSLAAGADPHAAR